jgi:hypothetical protein
VLILKTGPRFPGSGLILGRRHSPAFEPWTRSWGYGRRPRPQAPSAPPPEIGEFFLFTF